jgi:hypothetical protein
VEVTTMAESSLRTRKPARLSTGLQRDLARYAVAASAAGVGVLSLAAPMQAEIIHTKVDRVIAPGQSYSVDLNHDGIVDFSIQNISHRCTRTFTYCPEVEIVAYPANGNEIEYGAHPWYGAALRPGAVIGSGAPMNNAEEFMADEFRSARVFYYFGSWLGVKDRFLGLSFQINGETHYGWARLTVRSPEKYRLTAFLRDFAYETAPNTPIEAGAIGQDDSAANDAKEDGQKLSCTLGALARGTNSAE